MPIERLSAAELVMLWPDEVWPQEIGALLVLDGRFDFDRVRQSIAGRLHMAPRFRQLLATPPPSLGGPLWVDDPAFDLDHHLHVVALSPNSGDADLFAAVTGLVEQRLDRTRPLWGMWFLTGLEQGRVGVLMKMHHAIGDAIAGVATLACFLDLDPDAEPARPKPWMPAPAATERELALDERQRRERSRAAALSSISHPVATLRAARAAWPAIHELLAEAPLPATSLDRRVGSHRKLAVVRGDLDAVKAIAHANRAKVNDVLLAVIAGGIRALLAARGEAVEGSVLRIYVPVSLRRGQYAGARGNEIGQMVVPLPLSEDDPLARLHRVAAETAMRKARTRHSVGGVPSRGIAAKLFLRLLDRQRVNVESADVPGPTQPLYLAGARVVEIFPVLPLIAKVALGIAGLSYAGRFDITAVGDADTYPDLDVLAAGMSRELSALGAQLKSSAAA